MDWNRISQLIGNSMKGKPHTEREKDILARIVKHRRRMAKVTKANRVPPKVTDTPQWRIMRRALAKGGRIVAFDSEWQRHAPYAVTELGVAIYQHGNISHRTIRVRGAPHSEAERMTEKDARKWLRGVMREADLLVGHALKNDRDKMDEWRCPLPASDDLLFIDTAMWSRSLNPVAKQPMKLVSFCEMHGVETLKAHVAGNDALMTLRVALTLAGKEP